jgi:hypothetical protein
MPIMSRRPPDPSGEEPRSEPEIIPPSRAHASDSTVWASASVRGRRVYVARLGPFTIIILLLAIALFAALLVLLLIGAFVIWIPVIILLIAAAAVSAWWRRLFRG